MGLQEIFNGQWKIERVITGSHEGCFEGVAMFSPASHGVKYRESGVLTVSKGLSVQTEREYLYVFPSEHQVEIFFEDRRLFVSLDFRQSQKASAEHFCGHDIYRVCYQILNPVEFSVRIQVQGPSKDYEIQTCMKKSETITD